MQPARHFLAKLFSIENWFVESKLGFFVETYLFPEKVAVVQVGLSVPRRACAPQPSIGKGSVREPSSCPCSAYVRASR